MLQKHINCNGTDRLIRVCDCEGCANRSAVEAWPGGPISSGGFRCAVGPRQGSIRMGYDVCPECAAAGRLPPKAENPQPWPMRGG